MPITRRNWDQLNHIHNGEYSSVIHCAYDLKHSINKTPSTVLDSNIISTAKMLEICVQKNIANFIFISSCAVYGESSNSAEEKPSQPITMNGHIKAFNEELVKSFCSANEINFLIIRPFNSYGGCDTFSVVQKAISAAQKGSPFEMTNNGIAERDFIHIEDIAKAIVDLSKLGLKNEIINIGTGKSVKIADIVSAVEAKFGKMQILHKENPSESLYSRANVKKLKKLINFQPRDIFEYINSTI